MMIGVRDRAEIERSAYEAAHTPDTQLRASEANLLRYMRPPRTTPFPLEFAYSMLGDVRGQTVLDFGCGSGENTLLLVKRGARVVGVDLSADLIAVARRRLAVNGLADRATFVVGSAHDLPVLSGSIDVVFGIAILHHLDLGLAAREVHRVLNVGGRAIFQEPLRDSRMLRFVRSCIPYRAPDVSPFERPLRSDEIRAFTGRFSRSEIRAFSLPFVNLVQVVPRLRPFVHPAYRLDRQVLQRWPGLAAYAGIRVFETVK